ncbi:MAG TPA: peptidylprolyl isomerase [Anaerolineales bacterium]|nr:peptidylprolyl isomerase [Anaerolineales bacterium]
MRKTPSFIFSSFLFPSFLLPSLFLLLLLTACTSSSSPAWTPPVIHTMVVPTQPSCSTVASEPTPGPDTPSLFPPVSGTDHVRGAENPIVTIVEYIDYQDHMSGLFEKEANRLLETHPDELQIVSRIFPALKTNDKAALAAQAVEAAAQQDRFWEMHDLLYAQQENWTSMSVQDFEHWLTAQASALSMNVDQFQTDLKREEIVAGVQQAWERGQKIGMPVTPIILINGQIYSGPLDYTSINEIIALIALGKRQFSSCPPVTVQTDKEYLATLHTEKGDVVIQLFADKAPLTVNSFLFLAKSGWYDNITFHQVIPDVFAGTGDPSGTGRGNPGYYMITEIHSSLTFDKPGMVAMANAGPDASGSQFFITYAAAPQYDGQYTIFGQVLSGMDVLKQLTPRDPQPGIELPPGDKVINITVEEK